MHHGLFNHPTAHFGHPPIGHQNRIFHHLIGYQNPTLIYLLQYPHQPPMRSSHHTLVEAQHLLVFRHHQYRIRGTRLFLAGGAAQQMIRFRCIN